MHSRKDHLPEWKLTQFDGNPFNWHEWFGQFISRIYSAILIKWLKENAEGNERLKTIIPKGKSEEPVKQKLGMKVFASNTKVSDKNKEKLEFPPCSVCQGQHALRNCAVFKEKNATQRAKHVAEQRLCFACLQGNHSFCKFSKARKCHKPDCENTHNNLLFGAEKFFHPKDNKSSPARGNANT